MLESLIVYSILFFVMFACGITAAGREKKYIPGSGISNKQSHFWYPEMIVLLLSFAFVFGCRWGVGQDFFGYLDDYTGTVPARFELMFQVIMSTLKKLGAHYSVFFGIIAFIDIVLLYYADHNYKFIYPYIAFFLIFGSYYLPMMNAMRQLVAAQIFMVSIHYIDQKKLFHYIVCVIVALLFHHLSLILFVVYPILRWKDDWFKGIPIQLLLYAIAIFLLFNNDLFIDIIEKPFEGITGLLDYERYSYDLLDEDRMNRNKFGNNSGLGIWVNMFKTIPIILLSKDFKAFYKSSYFNMLYSLYFVSILLSLILGGSIILNRLTYFFVNFQILVYSLFVYYCFVSKKAVLQVVGILLMLIHIPLFINIISNPNSTAQFLFFWQQPIVGFF